MADPHGNLQSESRSGRPAAIDETSHRAAVVLDGLKMGDIGANEKGAKRVSRIAAVIAFANDKLLEL